MNRNRSLSPVNRSTTSRAQSPPVIITLEDEGRSESYVEPRGTRNRIYGPRPQIIEPRNARDQSSGSQQQITRNEVSATVTSGALERLERSEQPQTSNAGSETTAQAELQTGSSLGAHPAPMSSSADGYNPGMYTVPNFVSTPSWPMNNWFTPAITWPQSNLPGWTQPASPYGPYVGTGNWNGYPYSYPWQSMQSSMMAPPMASTPPVTPPALPAPPTAESNVVTSWPVSIEQLFDLARMAPDSARPALLRRAAELLEKAKK